MFENPRRGRQARNFTTNVPKILVLKSSSEQIFSRKLPLGAPDEWNGHLEIFSRPQVTENSRQHLPLRTDILQKRVMGSWQKTVVGCPWNGTENFGRFGKNEEKVVPLKVLLFYRKISTGMNRSIWILPGNSGCSIQMVSARWQNYDVRRSDR